MHVSMLLGLLPLLTLTDATRSKIVLPGEAVLDASELAPEGAPEPEGVIDIGKGTIALGRMLGHSDFGYVFEGQTTCPDTPKDSTGPAVAVTQNIGSTSAVENEFVLMEQLNHPNIIKCFGHTLPAETDSEGAVGRWSSYGAMELAHMGDLDNEEARALQHLSGRALVSAERVYAGYIVEQFKALEYLHAMGVIHHDIKGSNIVVVGGHAKFVGFGVACCIGPDDSSCMVNSYSVPRCQLGSLNGAIHTMSPAHFKGDWVPSPQDDLWSAGVMLHRLVRGRMPTAILDKSGHLGASSDHAELMQKLDGHVLKHDRHIYNIANDDPKQELLYRLLCAGNCEEYAGSKEFTTGDALELALKWYRHASNTDGQADTDGKALIDTPEALVLECLQD